MQVDLGKIEAEVYAKHPNKDILYVKITIPGLQMYIDSCTVRPSPKYGGLWFQMPKYLINGKWQGPIEFQNSSAFYDLLYDEAMRVVDQYIHDKRLEDIFPGAVLIGQDEVHDVGF